MAKDNSTSSTPSLTPPLTEEELLSRLRLLRSRRVGVSTFFRLMSEHGSADAALAALPAIAAEAGVRDYTPCLPDDAERERDAGHRAGARLIAFGAPDYPALLAQIPDPPPLFWAIGDIAHLHRPVVAVVGARNASSLGERMARRLCSELGAAGQVIVSGLARGIDTVAHKATLSTGTAAVFAGGVDVIYPTENAVLGREIGECGVCVSEQPMHLSPQARHFPRRNRIISGLARALVVIEAAGKSGSLITARTALDQGREVMAVPGHPFDARASGCNMLLRDGATLVRGADDVLEALAVPTPAPRAPQAAHEGTVIPAAAPERHDLKSTSRLHDQILDRLGPSPLSEDQLIRDLGRSAGEVGPELVELELEGRIERRAGGLLSRCA